MADTRSQARDWVLRLHEHPDDAELHVAFADWIAGSDARAEAWTRAERAWQVMGSFTVATPPMLQPTSAPQRSVALSRRQLVLGASAAAAASLAAFALLPEGDFRTGTGQSRRIRLADGSRVDLDSRSALDVAFSGTRRTASLRKGRAFFDIEYERQRPFLIAAGDAQVRVLGTAFAVERDRDSLSVAVVRGKVEVSSGRKPQSALLLPGERLTIAADGAFTRETVDPTRIAAWREGKIYAANRTVGDLIEELRSYQRGVVLLNAPRLAARPVTGLYHLDDPVSTISDIVIAHGGKIKIVDNFFIYISDS